MAIPETMKAWTFEIGKGEPTRKTVPVPKPGPDQVLIKVEASGVCHSDCDIVKYTEAPEHWQQEFILGHEGAGTIASLGPGPNESSLKIGDRVAIHAVGSCKECVQCKSGSLNLCKSKESGNYGIGRNGAFADYIVVKRDSAVKLAPSVSFAQGAVAADAVVTAYNAVKNTAAVKPGHTVVIFGLGGLGLNALQTAFHLGAGRVLVVDKRRETLNAAVKLGVDPDDAFDGSKPVHELLAQKGVQVNICIDFVGHEDTIREAQLLLSPGGTFVLVGMLSKQATFFSYAAVMNGLTIRGSYYGGLEAFEECLDLIAKGVIVPQLETGSIEDLVKVIADLDVGKIRSRMVLLPT